MSSMTPTATTSFLDNPVLLDDLPIRSTLSQSQSSSYALLQQDEFEESLPLRRKKTWFYMDKSWKSTVASGVVIAALVLLVSLIFFLYMVKKEGFQIASVTLFTGSCEKMKHITIWVDLLVNVLSTLLLGASKHCAQLLSSPERSDVDKAHQSGKSLSIGVPSIKNLFHVRKKRSALWLALFTTSLPLHLLANSIVYSQTYSNDFLVISVTEDFVLGSTWSPINVLVAPPITGMPSTGEWYSINDTDKVVIRDMQLQAQNVSLKKLDNEACIEAYAYAGVSNGAPALYSNWSNVLLVTNVTQHNNLIGSMLVQSPLDSNQWACTYNQSLDLGDYYLDTNYIGSCNITTITRNWQIFDAPQQSHAMTVKYCMAETSVPHCSVKANPLLLLVVMICNITKLGCLAFVLCQSKFEPLVTAGDAISSFLRCPDSTTKGIGPLSRAEVALSRWTGTPRDACWQDKVKFWANTSGPVRWCVCVGLCICIWFTGMLFVITPLVQNAGKTPGFGYYTASYTSNSYSLGSMWAQSIGATNTLNTISPPGDSFDPNFDPNDPHSLLANAMVANIPQLGVSMFYLFYNSIFTTMLVGREISTFVGKRKPLRTTAPRGHQDSTYWLQVPFRYSVPFMACMAILHWLVSRSLFLIEIVFYTETGALAPRRTINSCEYSGQAVILALVASSVILIALIGFALQRLPRGIPVMGSCSMAISAACHADPQEKHIEVLPLMYGVIPGSGRDEKGRQHVGFSSKQVEPLVSGVEYC
ncbi:hypothetical protein MBLNU457_6491t1 [Dothideomycetes sp. NU457]